MSLQHTSVYTPVSPMTTSSLPTSQIPIYNSNFSYAHTTYNPYNTDHISSNGILIEGSAYINGNLVIQGQSLGDRLDKIEQRLAIIRSNDELEAKWDELKSLGDQYRLLEREIIDKEKMWEILKR